MMMLRLRRRGLELPHHIVRRTYRRTKAMTRTHTTPDTTMARFKTTDVTSQRAVGVYHADTGLRLSIKHEGCDLISITF
nr:hypothetical protein [Tanacetum cinerariifolium]